MDLNSFPTKGNLILAKNSLALARQGYSLMDRKRNILIRELTTLIDQAKDIQKEIDVTFREAYEALEQANIDLGINSVREAASTVPEETSLSVKYRSIMGTDIPLVRYEKKPVTLTYSLAGTSEALDNARIKFARVKDLTIRLSSVENSCYRLATNIRKTQKRANALKNITIPSYEHLSKTISDALEEKDREEFTRLKVIKRQHA
ncbi:V-type ATP synthase subunit D [Clostridium vitabionis]|jgi:V/A-type H+-transporting ATPase subunit D|uniref:V-type ATP synthase subunit D n=1 Tax=Clostridium vitabionis TaxID=2784388 RepID=UPI00188C1406|nr:V-type ATP synthase subunit D [Clostridium vitabionis]